MRNHMRRIALMIAVVLFLMPVLPAFSLELPSTVTLNLSKGSAGIGERVTASGAAGPNAWVPIKVIDEAGSIIVFDTAKADESGNYSIDLVIPATAAGTLTIVGGEGRNVANETLSVSTTPGGDTITPTWTDGTLTASNVSRTWLTLSWRGADDNVGVTGYRIYQDGTLLTTSPVSGNSYTVTGLEPDTAYTFTVQAVDAAGNESSDGPSVPVTTRSLSDVSVTLELSKHSAQPGDSVTASGTADPDEWVSVKVLDSAQSVIVYDAVKSDTGGSYSCTFKVPATAPGTLTVVAGYGSNVDNKPLTVTTSPGDTSAPSWSGGSLTASGVNQAGLTLRWSGAADNVGVTGYRIYQDGALLTTSPVAGDRYTVTGLSPGTAYTFTVQAVDAAGNESTDGPSVTVTTAVPITDSDVTITDDNKNLAVTEETPEAVTITVSDSVTDATISVSALLGPPVAGTVTTAALPALTIAANTSVSAEPVEVSIPAGTTVSAPEGWDGTINVPTVRANDSVTVTPDSGNTATVNTVIEIGFGDVPLTFSKAVRILIPGQAGKDAGYSRGGVFTKITTVLDADSQEAGDALPAGGDGKIDVGNDLAIWTKHFTSFVTYTQTPVEGDTTAPTWLNRELSYSNVSQTGLTLSWNDATDNVEVTGYKVYQGDTLLTASPVTGNSYNVTGLNPGTTYTFTVEAVDAAGNESTDGPGVTVTTEAAPGDDTTAPTWPDRELSYSNVSRTGLTLSWNDATDNVGVTGYKVYQGDTLLTTVPASETSYSVTGLNPGTTYTFTVEAVDAAGNESTDGPSVTVTTEPAPGDDTSAPTWLNGTLNYSNVSQSGVTLSWSGATDNVGVTGYKVYQDGTLLTAVPASKSSYTVTDLSPDTAYTFKVQAVDGAGNESVDGPRVTVRTLKSSVSVTLELSKYAVRPGDSVIATGKADPNTFVSIKILDSRQSVIYYAATMSDASGNYSWLIPLSSTVEGTLTVVAGYGTNVDRKTLTVDTSAPSWIDGTLTASNVSRTGLTLNWSGADDNLDVTGYNVYQDDTLLTASPVSGNSYNVTGLHPGTTYIFTVQAVDEAGNESTDGLSVTVTTSTAVPIIDSDMPITADNKNLAITAETPEAVTITVPDSVTDATISVSALLGPPIDGTVTTTALPELTIKTNTLISSEPIEVSIPAGTTVSGPEGWDGTINLPTVRPNDSVTVTPDSGNTATVNTVIEIGFGDVPLTFDKAVRILIPGQAGKDTGYSRGGVFTKITTVLDADSQAAGDALPSGGDGRIDVDDDLAIWTKHFTSFVTYTQTPVGGDTIAPTWIDGKLTASNVSRTSLTLSWNDATDNVGVTGYNVYQGTTKLTTSPIAGTSYNVTGLNPGTVYTFRVQAVDAAGNESSDGPSVTVTTEPAPGDDTSAPTWIDGKLTASNVSRTSLTLSWSGATDNVGVTGYKVYQDDTLLTAVPPNESSYSVTDLSADTRYTFTVQAVDAAGNESSDGPSVNVTTLGGGGGGGGGGGSSTPQAVTSITGTAMVPPGAGGTVSLGDEATIVIPANALQGTSKVEVKIQKVDQPPAAPAGFKLAGAVYEFSVGGKDSYSFAKKVTIKISFDPDSIGDGETPMLQYYDQAQARWVDIGGSVSGNLVTAQVDHFTQFAVMVAVEEVTEEEPPQVPGEAFTDIAGHWAFDNVNKLVSLGAIAGYPDGSFKPDNTITRAEFATVLAKAFKLAPQSGKVFTDTAGHWARDYIAAAAASGIVSGYDDTTFGPDHLITREQMAVMIVKAANLAPAAGETSFADSGSISVWAREAVAAATQNGVISGYPDNTVRPLGNATRAEAVTVIVQALK